MSRRRKGEGYVRGHVEKLRHNFKNRTRAPSKVKDSIADKGMPKKLDIMSEKFDMIPKKTIRSDIEEEDRGTWEDNLVGKQEEEGFKEFLMGVERDRGASKGRGDFGEEKK